MESEGEFEAVMGRLRAALKMTTETALASALGMGRTAYQQRKARGSLPVHLIERLCLDRGIDIDWVMRGVGDPGVPATLAYELETLQFANDQVGPLQLDPQSARLLTEALTHVYRADLAAVRNLVRRLELVLAPRFEVTASAGNGAYQIGDEAVTDVLAFKRDYLRELGVTPERVAVIAVHGDSMAPTLQDGDLIIVDTTPPERRMPGIYVLVRDDTLLVKRLAFKLNGDVEVRSDNQAYPGETLSAPEFAALRIVGRMVRRVVR